MRPTVAAVPIRRDAAATWAAAGALVLGLLALAYAVRPYFGALIDQPLDLDELHFASCAARAAIEGMFSTAACHDNKGPLMTLLYQVLQHGRPLGDLLPGKLAALALLLVITVQCGWLALRVAGRLAALLTAACVVGALAPSPDLFGLKPDTLGAAFLLAALAPLVGPARRFRWWRLFGCGVFLGLAMLSKQTYGLVLPWMLLWLVLCSPASGAPWMRAMLRCAVAVGVGAAAPMLLFWLVFQRHGQGEGYVASLFLYPSVYGAADPFPPLLRWVWRSVDVFVVLTRNPLLLLTFFAAWVGLLLPVKRGGLAWADPLSLLVMAGLAMGSALWIAPVFFPQHAAPSWILMSIIGGILVARIWAQAAPTPGPWQALVLAIILTGGLISITAALKRNNAAVVASPVDAKALADVTPRFAFILGMWHHLYVTSNLVPATQVMFPWALPGVPGFWAYTPPAAGGARKRWLDEVQQHNLRQLFEDFRKTPPEYIVVIHAYAKAADSHLITDVPGLDDYIRARCTHDRDIADDRGKPGAVFRCRAGERSAHVAGVPQ